MAAKLTAASLRKAFSFYNEHLFGGKLSMPKFRVCKMKSDLARWYEPSDELPSGLMVVASNQRHPFTWRSTLVHEMAHIAVPEHENDHHGVKFTAECNRLGALLGLEPCDVSDSWCWPQHSWNCVPCDGTEANFLDD